MKEYQDLFKLLEKYAKAVGIDRKYLVEDDGRIWAGRYAQIALCIVKDCTLGTIMNAKEAWQQKLDEHLTKQEKQNSTVIDGYLILVLPECPKDKLRPYIREVELDTSTCRKHVVWPEQGDAPEDTWRRIFKVTVLGLPTSPELARGADMPVLSESQKTIWNEIRVMGAGRAAGKLLAEELQ